MKLSDMKTIDEVIAEDLQDPEFREIWDRTAFARAVALAVVEYRAKNKLTQRGFCELTGISQPQLARLEVGETPPRLETLMKLTAGTGLRFRLEIVDGGAEVTSVRRAARKAS